MMNVLPVLGNLHRPVDTVCDITVAGKIVTVLLKNGDGGTFISAVYLAFQLGTSCRFGHDEDGTMYCSKML